MKISEQVQEVYMLERKSAHQIAQMFATDRNKPTRGATVPGTYGAGGKKKRQQRKGVRK